MYLVLLSQRVNISECRQYILVDLDPHHFGLLIELNALYRLSSNKVQHELTTRT